MPDTQVSIDQLLREVVAHDASDLHLTTGSAPVLRIRGELERMNGVPCAHHRHDPQPDLRRHVDRAAEGARDRPPDRHGVLAARPRALPRERVLPARVARRGIPSHPARDQVARGARDSGDACTVSRRSRAASCSSPARPARASRRRSPRSIDEINGTRVGSHPHDRGSHRVRAPPQALRRQPARDRHRRDVVRRRPSRRAAPGPRRDPPRRDARPRDDRHRADRRRDRPPRLRHAAHAERAVDRRPHHRRLPGRAAGPGADAALDHARGHRHPDPDAERRRDGTGARRSRSCFPTTPPETSSARARSSRSTP